MPGIDTLWGPKTGMPFEKISLFNAALGAEPVPLYTTVLAEFANQTW